MTDSSETTRIIRLSRQGRMTIPFEFRKRLVIAEGSRLRLTLEGDELRMTPIREAKTSQGSPGLRALYEYFAPVREEILASGITQEELYALIDTAVEEVRARHRTRPE